MKALETARKLIRVLIVTADEGVRRHCAACLAPRGFSVEKAEDGDRAWKLLRLRRVDLLIVDHARPGRRLLALLQRLSHVRWRLPMVDIAPTSREGEKLENGEPRPGAVVCEPFSDYELLLRVDMAMRPQSRDPFGWTPESAPADH